MPAAAINLDFDIMTELESSYCMIARLSQRLLVEIFPGDELASNESSFKLPAAHTKTWWPASFSCDDICLCRFDRKNPDGCQVSTRFSAVQRGS